MDDLLPVTYTFEKMRFKGAPGHMILLCPGALFYSFILRYNNTAIENSIMLLYQAQGNSISRKEEADPLRARVEICQWKPQKTN